jgi:MFS family permease
LYDVKRGAPIIARHEVPASSFTVSRLFSPLAALAAAVSPWRAGSPSPAVAPPLAGAPGALAPEAHPIPRSRLRRSLRACTAEGLVAEVVSACAGGAVLTGWAIHLHASALLTGLVVALPQMAQVLQIPAAWSTALLGHRRACLLLVGASRQVLLPLVLLPFIGASEHAAQAVLVAVSALAAVLGVLGNNAWVSWMGELVPRRIRGRYFGRRTALCTVGGAIAAAASGLLLDGARARGLTGAALALLQLLACGSGVLTVVLMLRQHDPAPRDEAAAPPAPRHALLPLRDPSVRGLLVHLLAWNVAVGVAGSFFSLHMLRNLRMGFTLVALHGAGLAAARVLAAPVWGRLIDRLGARPVLITCGFGVSLIPLIWLFPTPARLWPLVFDAVLAGALWGGHNLATFALPLTVTPRRGRPFYLAAFAATGGLAFSLATAAGGALAGLLPERTVVLGRPFASLQVLFAVSAVLRFSAAFLALRIQEPAAAGVSALFAGVVRRELAPRPVRPRVARAAPRTEPPEKTAAAG